MISDVRGIFASRIKEVDSAFREWTDAFNFENIPSTRFNKAFHISYSVPSIEKGQTTITQVIAVVVRLCFSGGRDAQAALDTAMDTAGLVQLQLISKSETPEGYLYIDCNSIEPQALDTNDNKMIIVMNFTAAKYFTNC